MAVVEFSMKEIASQTWRRLLATGLRIAHRGKIEVLRLGPVLVPSIRSDAVLGGRSNPLDFLQQ